MPPTVAVPRGRLQQPAQHADRRGLAGAVAAEKAEDLALPHVERQVIDGDEVAEAPREIGDGDGVHWPRARASRASASRALAIACVRSSSACSSATCASSTSVLVATPAANRSPTTRRASVALRTPSVAASIAARLESTSLSRCRISTPSDASNSASRALAARADAAASATSLRVRPPSKSGQLTLTLASHDVCHAPWRGKMRGFGRA